MELEIPGKVTKVSYEDRTEFALVIRQPLVDVGTAKKRGNRSQKITPRFLVRPLPEGGRWAGLWDFPRTTQVSYRDVVEATKQLSAEVGVNLVSGMRLTTIKHAVTKYRISLHVHDASPMEGGLEPGKPWKYASLAELSKMPMSVTGRKIVQILADDQQLRLPIITAAGA